MKLETTIIQNLISSEKFARVVVPFLKTEYFADKVEGVVAEQCVNFFNKHNQPITPEILTLELQDLKGISDSELASALEIVKELKPEPSNHDWLVEQTEAFCKKRSVYLAILESISILDGENKKLSEDSIPKILQDALAVSFDTAVGHEYVESAEDRWEFYNREEECIPFGIDELDKATKGGLRRKALYAVAATSGGGKSILLTNTAANALKMGKNVLYISMEMSEERVAERIDANLMNVEVDSLKTMSKDSYLTKIANISAKTNGKLFIKEYPTSAAHAGHFRGLIEELKTKQNFVPELLIVDYLGICASSRMKMGGSVNTYSYQKSIAEELRGLGMEYNIPVLTAVQLNRGSYGASDVDMSATADSMGVPMSLDFYFALVATDELSELDQVLGIVLKNRYGDLPKFIMGLIKAKMQFYNVEKTAQGSMVPKVPDSLKTSSNEPMGQTTRAVPLFDRSRRGGDTSAFKF